MNRHSPTYRLAWNSIVNYLQGHPRQSDYDTALETFREAAHRNLLTYDNVEASQAVLDCTEEFSRTGTVPEVKR